jgi:protein-disulfide isomerase
VAIFNGDKMSIKKTTEGCATRVSKDRLERDLAEARLHDVNATPTLFVNGRKYLGFRDKAAFAAAIDLAAQSQAKRSLTQ